MAVARGHVMPAAAGNVMLLRVHSADMCLSPGGRGEAEVVVSVPNEFLVRIPAPDREDAHFLEQIAEKAVTTKCGHPLDDSNMMQKPTQFYLKRRKIAFE